jgi:hypothetical protein
VAGVETWRRETNGGVPRGDPRGHVRLECW